VLFHTPFFLFLFLPLLLLTFYGMHSRWRNHILLGWSFLFYCWGEPRFFPIAILSALLDYQLAAWIFKAKSRAQAKSYVSFAIIANLLLLVYFKYMDFLLGSSNVLLTYFNIPSLPLLHIALPIGVSFLVFEKITYVVDIYRGKSQPAHSIKYYLLYIFLFPKLLAGPIVKYHDIAAQLRDHHQSMYNFLCGFKRFLLGLIKKVLIADTFAEVANQVFSLPGESIGFYQAWLGALCFAFQIYFDFSAYSDMAIGLARMFGFKLMENFNMPYIATSFTDFWRRWHISLSTWIKEYLYIPLGGNQVNSFRIYVNLWLCFLLSGLWHGANWNFILWGMYNGVFLIIDRLCWLRWSQYVPPLLNVVITFFFIVLGWVIFRVTSLAEMATYFKALFNPWQNGHYIFITSNQWTVIAIGLVLCFVPLLSKFDIWLIACRSSKIAKSLENWGLVLLSLFAIAKTMATSFSPFLYFRF